MGRLLRFLISGFCKKNLASVEVWLIKFSRRDMVVRQMLKKISTRSKELRVAAHYWPRSRAVSTHTRPVKPPLKY